MQQPRQITPDTIHDLERKAYEMSRQIIEITTQAGSGHPSSSLSMIDILAVLYFGGLMHYDAAQPDWPARDRFILSKGHGVPALYVALAHAGYFAQTLLPTLRQTGSPLEGHPN
ncbi:MAG: transketolase, partial [Anaerolineales bacterium]